MMRFIRDLTVILLMLFSMWGLAVGCSSEASGDLHAEEMVEPTPAPTPDVNYNFDVRHIEPDHWVKTYKVKSFTTDGCIYNFILRDGSTMSLSGSVRVRSR